MRRASEVATAATDSMSPLGETRVSIALTFQGLRALGVPQESLDTFAWEFRQGMAARANTLGDSGQSGPDNWEPPLGTPDVHVVLVARTEIQRLPRIQHEGDIPPGRSGELLPDIGTSVPVGGVAGESPSA